MTLIDTAAGLRFRGQRSADRPRARRRRPASASADRDKVGLEWDRDGKITPGFSGAHSTGVEDSLRRLRTDVIDI